MRQCAADFCQREPLLQRACPLKEIGIPGVDDQAEAARVMALEPGFVLAEYANANILACSPTNHGDYMRHTLFALAFAFAIAPLGAQSTATVCKDGSSSATSGRGACSGHGGVDTKATAKAKSVEKKAEKAEKKADKAADNANKAVDKVDVAAKQAQKAETKAASTEVTCSDGSKSAGGRGACSGHGGIARSNPEVKKAEVAEKKVEAAKKEAEVAQKKAADAQPATRGTPPLSRSQPSGARGSTPATATKPSSRRSEDNDPTGAIAKCKDGMYSHSANRRGACSRHGGVATWM